MAAPLSRIAVIVCCFNRKATTLAGLDSVFRQRHLEEVELTVFLVDDASADGTAAAIAERLPGVRILHGDGSLWWVGGMRLAFAAAMAEDFDRYLWWNDDTVLADDAIDRMVACARLVEAQAGSTIVVGTTCDPITGARTYGGWKKRFAGLRVSFDPVEPRADQPVSIDTMNGNVVLIPAAIAKAVGNLEPRFRHRLADMDYGQRAVKAGFAVVLAPGCLGTCAANSDRKTWRDGRMPLTARWQDLMSPRGSEPKEWLLYTSRHYGWRWPLYFVSPYVKVLFKGMTARK